ncbi:hypothetical protein [Secundilactobacillus collinoides]|uniref:hypothetical protein n=1 Tax=Secundilactobacillus collinoides TaxID=33960 RepID=UPI00158559BA|nr:hypothetical protein [Secundilactobacillus collinoides]
MASTVKGTFFEDGKWVIKTVPIPRVIDNLMVTKKTAPFLAKLSKQAFLMNHRIGAKQTIYPLLKKMIQSLNPIICRLKQSLTVNRLSHFLTSTAV